VRARGALRCSADSTMIVKFSCVAKCPYGVGVVVTGSHDTLGNWDPLEGLQLEWSEGHLWQGEVSLSAGTDINMKFAKTFGSSLDREVIEWQDGEDLVLTVAAEATPLFAGNMSRMVSDGDEPDSEVFGSCYSITVSPATEGVIADPLEEGAGAIETAEPEAESENEASSVEALSVAAESLLEAGDISTVAGDEEDSAPGLPDGVEEIVEDTQGWTLYRFVVNNEVDEVPIR